MSERSWVLLALVVGAFAVLSRGREARQLTAARDPARLVDGWPAAAVARARRFLVLDLVVLVPAYSGLGVSLAADGAGGWPTALACGVLAAGALADVVEDVAALAYLARRSPALVRPMRWGARGKLLVLPGLAALLLLAVTAP
ncbi:hypothetical protein [Blastococcus sp. PRF04-17]|uniref:hypothetical protein n=1 Tax=Blastococcus sp. PRF04-17 TaxID=2933797 RepID=UPI001FF56630|nr:hypothetical protein [Blastococcus sp. PRF04-17]UOY03811.1 hypothetical protein MVA48_10980 [Blastococcus sp. PRF04-17]